ncbi:MAG TPA: diacylglycerol kinase family protein [Anaerolineaceae bacterium]|nr:diacylglycerol kinase family protein [Anaerolineaceae bacterium]
MQKFLRSRGRSFKNAFAGLYYVMRTQRNAWIHSVATMLVVLLAIWLQLSVTSWAILFLAMGMVWTAEFFNTALEAYIDLASPQIHPLARIGKDVGAGAVLVSAFFAAIVGFLIMGPPLLNRLEMLFHFR